jgi:hypothetical protein
MQRWGIKRGIMPNPTPKPYFGVVTTIPLTRYAHDRLTDNKAARLCQTKTTTQTLYSISFA